MNMFLCIFFSNLTYEKCLNAVQERAASHLNENDSNCNRLSKLEVVVSCFASIALQLSTMNGNLFTLIFNIQNQELF